MIGIGITTTPERKAIYEESLAEWYEFLPKDAYIVVINDLKYKGIAHSKNKCLAQLYELGCNEFFLVDDDVRPLKMGWELPYINHPEPHLMYQFKLSGKPANDMRVLYKDDETVAYSHTRGAFIYLNKEVLDTVGGFDEEYNPYGYEHPDLTNRIYNAGLTKYRAMDVPNSKELIYCLDQDGKVASSVPTRERSLSLRRNAALYRRNKNSKEYKRFM